jgi:hypothetical protein
MVIDGEEHTYEFEGFGALSNLTYNADFFHFAENDHVVMSRDFTDQIKDVQVSNQTRAATLSPRPLNYLGLFVKKIIRIYSWIFTHLYEFLKGGDRFNQSYLFLVQPFSNFFFSI